MSTLEKTREILQRLIAYPTVSIDSNLDMIHHMADMLEDLGARVDVYADPTGKKANMFATLGPDRDGGIMLSGHSDVVPVEDQDWSSDPFTMRESDGLLYGRGTCDMKGFIAATLAMAPTYGASDLRRPVHFAFTHDEETGCIGARALAGELSKRGIKPAVAIIGEPTSMKIIEGHKGCCEYTTHFTGLEGHSSAPDKGVNAVEYAVRYVARLMEIREEMKSRAPRNSRFVPPWTTMNVGSIGGGFAHNVIVGKASVEWEFRPVQDSDMSYFKQQITDYANDVLIPQMQAVHPASDIIMEIIGETPALIPMDDNEARDLVARLTGENGADVVAFGTEAGLFQALGMSVVVCGPGSIEQAHKPDEFVSLAQMQSCLDMLHGLGRQLI
jgi:acetylornithine deacetylase